MRAYIAVDIRVVDITEGAVAQGVAKLHAEAFSGYLNSRFGMAYITSYVNWFVHTKEALALAAIDHEQRVVGYALGVPSHHGHVMHRELRGVIACSLILRPWILFDARLWQIARSRFRRMMDREKPSDRHDLPKPAMALVAIGVGSSYRKQSVGIRLMETFYDKARSRKMESLYTWVYEDNTSARRLYERCGWKPRTDSMSESGTLKYSKLIEYNQIPTVN